MKTRNTNTYRATFTGLRGQAFGMPITFDWTPTITIYQARVSPELWRARPQMQRAGHVWEASSAIRLMQLITGDFARVVKPWTEWNRADQCIGEVDRTKLLEGSNGRVA